MTVMSSLDAPDLIFKVGMLNKEARERVIKERHMGLMAIGVGERSLAVKKDHAPCPQLADFALLCTDVFVIPRGDTGTVIGWASAWDYFTVRRNKAIKEFAGR